MGERQFGPYRLVRQIAVGGMAEIHLAKTKGIAGFEKYVALKMIHPNFAEDDQFIQMLVDEAKIAVQLNHGNIAQTFDLGRVGDTFYITMEYVDGADLYKILRRGSERDVEMPLDVCAFVAKEVASALDHAHRKRDHVGTSLGIVHRDVSPQNVLISFAGEVKLVDFGIAKATMKARQTAAGVIKGKYYYMSPEQASGDAVDFRSDIFSAGIVLYEMITGQMLYLEEDLHRLLDMARKAAIAPPSTLRKGIPPQLERIVMHALAKAPGDRYQGASDLASDLERFLHAYAPVFTAAKLATLLKQIVGDPMAIPDDYVVEVRDGPVATHSLHTEDLIHSADELRDENSVIFRVADLQPPKPERAASPVAPVAPVASVRPTGTPASRVTRQADLKNLAPPGRPGPPGKIPSVPRVAPAPASPAKPATPPAGSPESPPARVPPVRAPSKPRLADEATREVSPAPPGQNDESGLLSVPAKPRSPVVSGWHVDHDTHPSVGDDLDSVGEHTMISAPPTAGFPMDGAGEDGIEATVITAMPAAVAADDDDEDHETISGARPSADEDGPTITRDFTSSPRSGKRAPGPPALAANIHAPAVSELRKPRASRKTPGAGVPAPNLLQSIVGAQPNEPMPSPRRSREPTAPAPTEDSGATTLPQLPPGSEPYAGQPYGVDASGMPLGVATPPPGHPIQMVPGVPPHLQPYAMQPGYPPQYPPAYPQHPQQNQWHPQQQVSAGGLYQLQPFGAPPPTPMSVTGQMRLFEAAEMPSQYKVSGTPRWLGIAVAAVIAVGGAATVTFLAIRSMREAAPTPGSIHIESVPPGGAVTYDGTRMTQTTPFTIDPVPNGTRHEIRVELARHRAYVETVEIPKQGGEIAVTAVLKPITGKVVVVTRPDGAEIRIDGQLRGRTPTTINDLDMSSARTIELRLKDYQPYIQTLVWPATGEIDIDQKLVR